MSSSALQKVIGVSPVMVGGALVVLVLAVVIIIPLLSMGTIFTSGFGLLTQGLASAEQALGTLLTGGSQVLDSGFQLLNAIQSQGNLIISNAFNSASSIFETFTSVMTTALSSMIQIGATAIAASGQIVVAITDTIGSSINILLAGISQIFFSIQAGLITFSGAILGGAIGGGGLIVASSLGFVSNVGAAIFNLVLTYFTQIMAIPLVLTIAFYRISIAVAFLPPQIFMALIIAFARMIKFIVELVIVKIPAFITALPGQITEKITEGFDAITDGLTGFLGDIFS
jgi:hypothetical protein